MGSPQLSDLGNSATFREEPIHIEFSAKEPSASDRCIANVILFKLACEAEMKIYGDDEEYQDQLKSKSSGSKRTSYFLKNVVLLLVVLALLKKLTWKIQVLSFSIRH